jgi:hypothetical protein
MPQRRGLQFIHPSPSAVTMGDIFQAAVNRAVQDYELNRLFNPYHYDYQI